MQTRIDPAGIGEPNAVSSTGQNPRSGERRGKYSNKHSGKHLSLAPALLFAAAALQLRQLRTIATFKRVRGSLRPSTALVAIMALGIWAGFLAGCSESEKKGKQDGDHATTSPGTPSAPSVGAIVAIGGIEGKHELGYMEPGSEHSVLFRIVNPSDKTMAITSIRSDCECIKNMRQMPKSLAPGESAVAEVFFKAPKDKQRYSHRVMVMTDDPNRRIISLRVEADVGVPLELRPGQIEAGSVAAGSQKRVSVEIVNRGKSPVRPLYATSSQGDCIAEVPRAEIAPGKSLSIPVVVRASDGAAGTRIATVLIHTDSPQQPTIEVRVRYEVAKERS
jgi:hypothetical protein